FATLAETWRGMAASSESLHALLDQDPAVDDLNRFAHYGSGGGLSEPGACGDGGMIPFSTSRLARLEPRPSTSSSRQGSSLRLLSPQQSRARPQAKPSR